MSHVSRNQLHVGISRKLILFYSNVQDLRKRHEYPTLRNKLGLQILIVLSEKSKISVIYGCSCSLEI